MSAPDDRPASTAPVPDRSARSTVAAELAAIVERTPDARLWAPPPLDKIPPLPGRPPAGITVNDAEVHVHLAVSTVDIRPLAATVASALGEALDATRYQAARVHVHIDRLEGDPFT